jgi:hypothetical protein
MPKLTDKQIKLLTEARDRLKWALNEDEENRKMAKDDLEFIAIEGAQWPQDIKDQRVADGRPCITVNKMPTFIDQVVGDQRQNRPNIKVFPVDDKGDRDTATVIGGWIKNVQHVSVFDPIIDHAFEHAVACGYGAFRVVTKYNDDDSFEQDAQIKKIDNALSVWWGPHVDYDCSDAPWCFLVSDMPRDEYKAKYDEEGVSFSQADSTYIEGWSTKDTVRIAEYFVKEPVTKTIYLLRDGRVVDTAPEMKEDIVKERKVDSYKVMWYLLTGNDIKETREWVGKKYIPVIPVWGKEINVAGKRVIRGLVRNAKDPQRMYNYWQSVDTETIALAPKAPFIVTAEQVKNHEDMWREANRKNFPYLIVNHDPKAPGWPQRQMPAQMSSALTTKLTMADQEIRDTMGLQKANMGMQSNERSGKAILERKKEGDTGTFAFIDNLVRSLEHLGRVLVDMVPTLLDTERIVRLGLDNGKFKTTAVNVARANPDGTVTTLNDITIGKYDVVCKVGPSFATQRSEARQSMSEFIQYVPAAAPFIGDLFAETMDWPRAEEVAERLKYLLPPEIKAKIDAKEAEEDGKGPPPPAPEQPALPPSPQQQAEMAMMEMKVKQEQVDLTVAELKVKQEEAKLAGIMLDNQIKAKSADMDVEDRVNATQESSTGETNEESGQQYE